MPQRTGAAPREIGTAEAFEILAKAKVWIVGIPIALFVARMVLGVVLPKYEVRTALAVRNVYGEPLPSFLGSPRILKSMLENNGFLSEACREAGGPSMACNLKVDLDLNANLIGLLGTGRTPRQALVSATSAASVLIRLDGEAREAVYESWQDQIEETEAQVQEDEDQADKVREVFVRAGAGGGGGATAGGFLLQATLVDAERRLHDDQAQLWKLKERLRFAKMDRTTLIVVPSLPTAPVRPLFDSLILAGFGFFGAVLWTFVRHGTWKDRTSPRRV